MVIDRSHIIRIHNSLQLCTHVGEMLSRKTLKIDRVPHSAAMTFTVVARVVPEPNHSHTSKRSNIDYNTSISAAGGEASSLLE